jgi:putative ABC transport system ATP-binding protein
VSGGQQQRCAIARAIVKNPKVLLCDEPTGALDFESSRIVLELLERVNRQYGTTMLIVTHNEAIRLMVDHIIKVHDGRIAEDVINEKKLSASEIDW